MEEQKSVPYEPDEAKMKEMEAYLDVMGDRIEVLECLKDNAYFFPDWLLKINEGIQNLIDYKQEKKIPSDDEKEVLAHVGYFFTKIAFFNGLISDWHREMEGGKEVTEEMLSRFSPEKEF